MFVKREPWTVVTGEEDQRMLVDTTPFQGIEYLANTPINFLDDITVQPAPTLSCKCLRSKQGHVGQAVWKIKEKRLVFFLLDEVDGSFRVTPRNRGLFSWPLDDIRIMHERYVPVLDLGIQEGSASLGSGGDTIHVIGVRNAQVGIEPIGRGKERF